jgi:antitoxin (DNA-binding transcriptional repressor) of toxin-antitoxin stability system
MDLDIGVRELRRNLAAALRRAAAGQQIVVHVADRPLARIGPLDPPAPIAGTAAGSGAPTIADLANRGLIVPARRDDRPPPDVVLPLRVGSRLDRLVAEIRA